MAENMMGIINPLKHEHVVVESIDNGAGAEFYVECSSKSNQLSVLTGPMATTAEAAVLRWNEEWEGRLK